MSKKRSIKVFDTTLRDGEQMPQLAFSAEEKVAIAKKLDEAGGGRHRGRLPRELDE